MTETKVESLAHRTVRNVAWLGSGQAIRQVVAMLTMVVLARHLGPSEFGMFAMAMFVNELAQLVVDFGIGSALIQRKEINRLELSSCFWINVAVAAMAAVILVAAGPVIADYFKQPMLRWLMFATAFNLLISAMAVLPQALLARRLAFRDIAVSTLIGSLSGAATAIVLALAGAGVWALACQPVVGSSVTLLFLAARAGWLPDFRFQLAAINGLLKFSGQLLLSNLVAYVTRSLPILILGPAMGVATLGLINMAYTIAWLPVAQFSQTVVKATFPVFAQLQNDMDRFREGFYRATGLVALFAFPLMMGIAVLAEELVPVVFGPNWAPASKLVPIACVPALLLSVTTLAGTVLLATGRADLLLKITLLNLPTTALFLWATRTGSASLAMAALAIAMMISSLVSLVAATHAIGAEWKRYAAAVAVPAACSVAMAALIYLAKGALPGVPPTVRLIGFSIAGAAFYLSAVWLVKRAAIEDLINLVMRRPSAGHSRGLDESPAGTL